MNSKTLRQKFIQYFIKNNHQELAPADLIPENDPSVLFTTAGMQQFKGFYQNPEGAPAKNIVSCQPCFRTSDIEEVGDETHLTFFEMLGNFSFGYLEGNSSESYFKEGAIKLALDFLTKSLGLKKERITCTIFGGDEINSRDDESAKILENLKIPFKEFGREDNFWGPTGDEGPCGPTVEFYLSPFEESDKLSSNQVEIWNLVFNQYFKDINGKYSKLQNKGVDTGMGLERTLAIINGLEDVYKIDLFLPIIQKIEELSGQNYSKSEESFRIIADHLRATVFLINQNILPANKEQGYIVRRIIRRAVVKGLKIGLENNFTSKIAQQVIASFKDVYNFNQKEITKILEAEETKFRKTLKAGLNLIITKEELTGEDLFNLYQSYGIPKEIAFEEARINNILIAKNADLEFKKLFSQHRDLSRTASFGIFRGGLAGRGKKEIKYHTATHLLQAALRKVLGSKVFQKGSHITDQRLRFDFSYPEKLTQEQIKRIEDTVNENIKNDLPVIMEEMSFKTAQKIGALGLFENKYGSKVKVYRINNVSCEICGGPHVTSTGKLGKFKIIKEESSSAGVRRIKAILE